MCKGYVQGLRAEATCRGYRQGCGWVDEQQTAKGYLVLHVPCFLGDEQTKHRYTTTRLVLVLVLSLPLSLPLNQTNQPTKPQTKTKPKPKQQSHTRTQTKPKPKPKGMCKGYVQGLRAEATCRGHRQGCGWIDKQQTACYWYYW